MRYSVPKSESDDALVRALSEWPARFRREVAFMERLRKADEGVSVTLPPWEDDGNEVVGYKDGQEVVMGTANVNGRIIEEDRLVKMFTRSGSSPLLMLARSVSLSLARKTAGTVIGTTFEVGRTYDGRVVWSDGSTGTERSRKE